MKNLIRAAAALALPAVALVNLTSPAGAVQPVAGNTPWAVLLCKYSDVSTLPLTKADAEKTFTLPGNGSMVDYWKDNSNGVINLTGSVVDDWQTINTKAHYHSAGSLADDRNNLMSDCIAAHPGVHVTPSMRVLAYTNADNGHTSGGHQSDRIAGGAVLEGTAFGSLYLKGQEMGHAYGLAHAYDADGVYNDEYDVMGDNGVGLAQADKLALGWLAPAKVATPATGLPSYELSAPFHATRPGWDIVKVADPADSSHFYTVEYRQQESWDAGLAVGGVVIHEITSDGTLVLQRQQLKPGIAALSANGSTWTSPNGAVHIKLVCATSSTGSATVTVDPNAYAQCGSGFTPPPANGGTTYVGGGGGGSVDVCTTCGPPRRNPIQFT